MWVYSSSEREDIDLKLQKQKVVLVGGFAESPYVHSRIEDWCRINNVSVKKPDGPLSKAIAHGALSWHLRSGVRTRIARLHYGAEVHILYDPNDPEMVGREKYMDPKGDWRVRGAWEEIVQKVKVPTRCLHFLRYLNCFFFSFFIQDAHLRAGDQHSAWFHQEISTVNDAQVEMELYAYRWTNPPRFFKTQGQ